MNIIMFFKNGECVIRFVFGLCKMLFLGIIVYVSNNDIINSDIFVYLRFDFFLLVKFVMLFLGKLLFVLFGLYLLRCGLMIFLVMNVFKMVIKNIEIIMKY